MEIPSFNAADLFELITTPGSEFVLLDVRNSKDFGRFHVEGPYPFEMVNVEYFDFSDDEEQGAVAQVPRGKPVRIVCAKEGSAKFVAEVLLNHGFSDVAWLEKGIKSWGNLLSPVQINASSGHDADYSLWQFRRPGKASCNYALVYGQEVMFFDPSRNLQFYRQFMEQNDLKLLYTFETHRQADYISGSPMLAAETSARIVASPEDFEGAAFEFTPAEDGAVFGFSSGGPEVKVLATPGHTPGSVCYLIDDKYLISGDTVFIKSIGRPDLGGQAEAWSDLLFDTMRQRILAMDKDVQVLPGHYASWDEADKALRFAAPLGEIIQANASIYDIADREAFFKFIQSNMRPQPSEYATIRLLNAGLAQADDEEQETLDLGKNECAAEAAARQAAQA